MQRNQPFSLWIFIIAALILVIFSVQNAQEVRFEFILWRTHLSLSVLLIVAFLIGLIAGAFFSFRRNRKEDRAELSRKNEENSQKDKYIGPADEENGNEEFFNP
ncbi:MAG: LapA family protein [Marinilabilia sp.]